MPQHYADVRGAFQVFLVIPRCNCSELGWHFGPAWLSCPVGYRLQCMLIHRWLCMMTKIEGIDHGNVYSCDHEAMVAETLYSCNCKYVHICSSPFPVFSCLINVKPISLQYITDYMSSLLDIVSCFDRGAHRDCFLKF
jgi:hypothetical protein